MKIYSAYAARSAKTQLEPLSFDPGPLGSEEVEIEDASISGRLTILFRKPFLWASPHVDREKVLRDRSLLNAKPFDQTFGVVRSVPLKNPSRSNPGLRSSASSRSVFPWLSPVLAPDPQSILVRACSRHTRARGTYPCHPFGTSSHGTLVASGSGFFAKQSSV